MTLKTCKKQLELAEKRGDNKAVLLYKKRIEQKMRLPKYANLNKNKKKDKK